MDGIKTKALETSKALAVMGRRIKKYFSFIFQIIGWVLVLYILTPLLASFQPIFFIPKAPMTISDYVLLITAAFVLAYTYETQKLREETIFQRRMSVAHDVSFRMPRYYRKENNGDVVFGKLSTTEALNNVCKLTFITPILRSEIGRCATFDKTDPDSTVLHADYFININEERDTFLETLRLTNGEIQARVLVTNGETFLYTFRAVTDNWRRVLDDDAPNLNDVFILIKKEIYEA